MLDHDGRDPWQLVDLMARRRTDRLWTFADRHGVQPTNNHAERALRGAVIYRKLSLGSQSEQGERRIERLLSASTTYRLRHGSLFEYLDQLLTAHNGGDPIPLLAYPHPYAGGLNGYRKVLAP
jgi:transposase IS66 family protein